jgi:hypothetical protein
MSGTVDAQLAALRQQYDQMRQGTELTRVTDTVWKLAREAGRFEERVEALRQGGYVFTQSLANGARDLRNRWRSTESKFDRAMREVRYDVERSLERADVVMRYAERAPNIGSIQAAQTEIQSVVRRLPEAQRRLADIYEGDERDINALDQRLDALEWSLQQIQAAAFQLDAGEALIIAAPAEWTQSAGDRRHMDGVLYLTDRRILFEQKERTGAFLGLFGGSEQQALTWALSLNDIEDVRAENRGIFGAKDMLFLRSRPGAERGEITVEVKRSADNQEWAAFIRQAKAGGYEQERQ